MSCAAITRMCGVHGHPMELVGPGRVACSAFTATGTSRPTSGLGRFSGGIQVRPLESHVYTDQVRDSLPNNSG